MAEFPPRVGHLSAAIHPPFRIELASYTQRGAQLRSNKNSLFGSLGQAYNY
jgi:hypothetical protein